MIDEKIREYLKTGQKFTLKEATLSRDRGILFLAATTNFRPDEGQLKMLRNAVLNEVSGLTDVEFQLDVQERTLTPEEILPEAFSYLRAHHAQDPWARALVEEGHNWEDPCLTLGVLSDRAAEELNARVAAEMGRELTETLAHPVTVRFVQNADAYEQTMDNVEKTLQADPPAEENRPEPKKNVTDGRLKGRPIETTPMPMAELPREEATVTLAGRVFSVETQEVKKSERARRYGKDNSDTSTLVTFCFSDRTDSACAKMFCENKEWRELEEYVSPGKDLIAHGKLEYDNFLHAMVLRVRDLGVCQMTEREDRAERKRIELHAHTKMSALDGVTAPEDLIRRAIAWGHDAVAVTDHAVVHALPKAYHTAGGKIKVILGTEGYLYNDAGKIDADGNIDYTSDRTYHIILLAKNEVGRQNLYRLVSLSHLNYFYKKARLPRSVLEAHREGLIIGSACQAGELYQAIVMQEPEERLLEIASFYDYLEVQPLSNNLFMINDPRYPTESVEQIMDYNRKVLDLGKNLGLPVVATSDTHYLDPEDNVVREIVRAGMGYEDIDKDSGLYIRTTEEMLEEFSYFDEEDRYAVVVENPHRIADMVEDIKPAPGREYPRPTIDGAVETLRQSCEERLSALYGDPAPADLKERLESELDAIIGNDYADLYVAAKMVVEKSNSDGYVVGSRGSVGSSFAAFMSGISEVNPLAPHYICPHCHHFEWGDASTYECGVDMPEKVCPECGRAMDRDGYTIPFETFLGFKGDKEPDIDLNFAGEYQPTAHKYVDEIFGEEYTFKAGTIGTVAEKTAYGFITAYSEATHKNINRFERERLAKRCEDVKRTTGQHPGGIVIVPKGHEIYEVCPIQYPANKKKSGIVTTHFEYHDYEEALLKLDLLGHDGPTMVRLLHNSTGIDPQTVPINDPDVIAIFHGPEPLKIKDANYHLPDGSYGIPEFGTTTARDMLNVSPPNSVGDLVRLAGLGHGTGVWGGNAQDLIKSNVATMGEIIATRDDIMTYLISKGLPKATAFDIMEKVRKGAVAAGRVKEWPEWSAEMKAHGVPDWYIDSCAKIEYMFPRGHAAAYVIMSCRIAYFKVHYPEHFYAARLTTKVDDFNWEVIRGGSDLVWARIEELDRIMEEAPIGTTITKEKNEKTALEIVYEMLARGYEFLPPSFAHSEGDFFSVRDGKVVVPLNALDGVGTSAATAMMAAYREMPFATVEDIQVRGKANKTVIDALRASGMLEGMEESNQMSFI